MTNDNALLVFSIPTKANSTATTINEYIDSLRKLPYKICEINTYSIYNHNLLLQDYEVIILHYSLFGGFDYLIDPFLLKFLEKSLAKKILILQDEHQAMNKRLKFIEKIKADVILTAMNDEKSMNLYKIVLQNVEVIPVLTGYVSRSLKQVAAIEYSKENLLFYRARKIDLGIAALEKYTIGKFFHENYSGQLEIDISFEESSRLYGKTYSDSLRRTKFTLGAEAGTKNIIFEPEIITNAKQYNDFVVENFNTNIENYNYRMISPRIFENAAYGVAMVLYEGNYSNVIKPWVHYIPLKKDHSNFAEVLKAMDDIDLVNKILVAAKKDLILSGRFDYEKLNSVIVNKIINLKVDNKKPETINTNFIIKIHFYYYMFKQHGVLRTKRVLKKLLT